MTVTAREIGHTPRFYVAMAAVCFVIPMLTFAPTYYLQLPAGTVVGTRGLHLHALVFTAWPALFFVQTWLAYTGRRRRHRAWGLAGVSLATALVISGFASVARQLDASLAAGYGDTARAFALLPTAQVLLFTAFFAAAIARTTDPEAHKRCMLLATIALMPAALVRIPFALVIGVAPGMRPGQVPPPPVFMPVLVALIADLLIAAAILYDWRTRGRPHKAYLVGGAATVLVHLLVVPISGTAGWHELADYLTGFAARAT